MKTETARERFAKALLGTERDGSQREAVVRRVESGAPRQQRGAEQRRAYPRDACRPGERCTPSVCFSCHSTCEVLVYTDAASGKVLRVEGDPNSPQTHGRLCAKGLASADLCHNPKRLTAPLRRIGERGEGRFEEIGWEEALDITAGKLREYRERLGPQSVALLEGTRRGWSRVYSRFANAFGTPNHGAAGRAYAYARFTVGLRRDVVQGISGWWGQYNINLTVPWGRYAQGVGTVCARGYLCRVTPVEEPGEAPEERQSGVAKGR